jgi:two-component system LytT family response regulator
MIHAQGRRYLVGRRLVTLDDRLPSPPFLRVHRSHIVNLDDVERMRLLDKGQAEVHMKSGATVPVSRVRSQELRRLSR